MSTRKTRLRVGVLGCGRIASAIHLPLLASIPDVVVTAIADPDEHRRREAARVLPRSTGCADFAELMERSELDAVVITLPNALHVPAAIAALRRGLHVYVEKPLAPDLAGGRRVLSAWREAGRVAMVGYNYRFMPPYQQARAYIASGRIGPVVAIRSVFSAGRRESPDWKRRRDAGGGVLLDLASHHLDLAAWLVGHAPRAVACDLLSRGSDDDVAMLQLEFPGGVAAQILAAFGGPELHRFEVLGERGRLLVDPYGADVLEVGPATLDRVRFNRLLDAARALVSPSYWLRRGDGSPLRTSYRDALTCFVRGAITGRQPEPDVAAGCETLAWLDAARTSARENRRVVAVEEAVA